MPTKRRKLAVRQIGISPAAIEAWRAGDYWALHHELSLKPWQMPDWHDDPPDNRPLGFGGQPDPAALKQQLIELAGPPPRRWRYNGHGRT